MFKKIRNFKFVIRNCNKGMTYVELIVVLGIFAVLSGVAVFNYGIFQANVDIKNLANDIALKIVEAQKSSMNGVLPSLVSADLINWKPSYGLYFNLVDDKSFIYFTDLDNLGEYENTENLDTINIQKNNSIYRLDVFYQENAIPSCLNDLTITFKRPNSGAIIKSSKIDNPLLTISYVRIIVTSPNGAAAAIKLYSSGRAQIDSFVIPSGPRPLCAQKEVEPL